jgi:hypothetical protein
MQTSTTSKPDSSTSISLCAGGSSRSRRYARIFSAWPCARAQLLYSATIFSERSRPIAWVMYGRRAYVRIISEACSFVVVGGGCVPWWLCRRRRRSLVVGCPQIGILPDGRDEG